MKDLTLVIPAKEEWNSLPKVLEEVKTLECKIIVVLERSDIKTINSIKKYNCKIIYQSGKGYGNAIIEGIKNTKTEFLCIFNADGSFNPKYLDEMLNLCKNKLDFVFASRYKKDSGSDDDTFLTAIGNFFFSKIGNIFFNLDVTDLLYTFVMGNTKKFKELKLKQGDFSICAEIPINIKKKKFTYINNKSYERARLKGKKKVSEFKDGLKILFYMLKKFFS